VKEEYEVIIQPLALNTLQAIYDYIAEKLFNTDAAEKLINAFYEKFIDIRTFPKIYQVAKTQNLKREYRRCNVGNFAFFYTINEEDKVIYVSRIYYGRQDIENQI